jgi:hypothetical protein
MPRKTITEDAYVFSGEVVSHDVGQYPFAPFARITLQNWMSDDAGAVYLSDELKTAADIDHDIDVKIKELEQLRTHLKQALESVPRD